MTEATRQGEKKPEAGSGPGTQALDPKADSSAAKDAKRQDKTKDKPDSGQNEDG